MASPQPGPLGNSVAPLASTLSPWVARHRLRLFVLTFWVWWICMLQLYILSFPTSGCCTSRILPGFLIPTASPTVVLPPSSYTWRWPGSTTPAGGVGWPGRVVWMVWRYFCKHYKAMEAILMNMFFLVAQSMLSWSFGHVLFCFISNGCAFRRSNDKALLEHNWRTTYRGPRYVWNNVKYLYNIILYAMILGTVRWYAWCGTMVRFVRYTGTTHSFISLVTYVPTVLSVQTVQYQAY